MGNILTPKFRVSYPNVFKPGKAFQEGQEPKYSVVAVFPKGADLSALKKAAEEAMVEKWGADKKKWPKELRSPFRKHEERAIEDEATGKQIFPDGMEAGGIFINLSSKQKPGLVDQNVQEIIVESDFYAGCYARATVRAYAYGGPGTKFTAGVGFGLQNIQKLADGDPMGSRTRPQDDFVPVAGAASATSDAASADSLFG
jgi:hypothetical protein